jgi:hypothetical protein
MEINTTKYTNEEIEIIIDKIEVLFISYRLEKQKIIILDKIDMKVYYYIIDFSKN